jgi:hypothetical protein
MFLNLKTAKALDLDVPPTLDKPNTVRRGTELRRIRWDVGGNGAMRNPMISARGDPTACLG